MIYTESSSLKYLADDTDDDVSIKKNIKRAYEFDM